MRDIQEILNDFRYTSQAIQEEEKMRETITQSASYELLQAQIDGLQDEQKKMLDVVPDSKEEYEMDKQELIEYMTENNIDHIDEFHAKKRVKNTVDVRSVLEGMYGDLDNLMLVTSITQKSLKDFIQANKEYKHLSKCIIEDGYTISDIIIPN